MEQVKKLLLAAFVTKDETDKFLTDLEDNFKIKKDSVFIYQLTDEDDKFIITFRLFVKAGKKVNLKKHFKNTIPIHKKGDCIYTINALNKLIESESGLEAGNINHKEYVIDWAKHQGKLLLINSDNLAFLNIARIFPI